MSTFLTALGILLVVALAASPALLVIWLVGLAMPGARVLPKWMYRR